MMYEFNAVYRRNRTKWICILGSIVLLLTIAAMLCGAPFLTGNNIKTLENGNVEYRVMLKDNDYYQTDSAVGGGAYFGELIDSVSAEFDYALTLADGGLLCKCSYDIKAYLEIRDDATDALVLQNEYDVLPERTVETSDGRIKVSETVEIDYGKYDRAAREILSEYSHDLTENELKLVLNVRVLEVYGKEISDVEGYETVLAIPLASNTVIPTVTTDGDLNDRIHIAFNDGGVRGARLVLLVAIALFDTLAITALVLFIALTADERARKTRALLSQYKGHIQTSTSRFDQTGYQTMRMESLIDMLEISHKLSSPLIKYEDRDNEITHFYVIAPPSVLYTFELENAGYCDTDRLTVTHWNYSKNGRTENLKQKLRKFLSN